MNGPDRQRARDAAWTLLQACLPEPGRPARAALAMPPRTLPVTRAVRCWTPLHDWEQGDAAMENLREVLSAYCALLPDDAGFEPTALISDGSTVVVEAIAPAPRRDAASITLVLTLHGELVDEIRCYADPRGLGPDSSPSAQSGTGHAGR